MKSRKSKFCLILLFSVLIVALCTFNLFAAESLTITDPADGAWVSYLDAPDVEWDKVTGAAGYRVSIRNTQTGELLVENKWTTKTYYSLDGKLDRAASEYKIWVGAMNSKDDNGEQAFSSDYITIYTYKEAPEIDGEGYKNVTSDSVVLYMEITRDNGESVTDSGFYLEEATSSKRTTYSFKNYGSYSATTKGYKEMTITGLKPGTKYYFYSYAVNSIGETETYVGPFTTKAATGSLSLSKTSVSWGWGAGNETDIEVTYSGSYSYSVDYDVSSSVKNGNYDYKWLTVSKSGSTLYLTPNRANYSTSQRVATVTVTSGGVSKTITVTQAKCGEASPTLTLTRGTVLTNGSDLGTYNVPQNVMEVWVAGTNVRKMTAHLAPVSGSTIQTCTRTDHISFDISNLTAGDYKITVYASNSSFSNDYYSQSPIPGGSMTLYFTLKNSSSGGGYVDLTDERFNKMNEDYNYTSSQYYQNLKNVKLTGNYAEDMITIAKSQVGYTEASNNRSVYALFWGNTNTGTKTASWCAYFVEWCAQLVGIVDDKIIPLNSQELFTGAFGSAASPYYMLKDYKFEVWYFYINNNGGINYSSSSNLSWKTDDNKVHNFTGVTDGNKISEGEKESFTPIRGDLIYFRPSKDPDRWGHVGIVDKVENGYIYFYDGNGQGNGIIISGNNDGVAYRYVAIDNYLITAYARPEYKTISQECNHIWGEWVNKGSYSERTCSLCGEVGKQTNYGGGETVQYYTVSYSANGGSNAPTSVTVKQGYVTLSSQTPTRSGYTFLGWAESSTASSASLQPGDKIYLSSDVTLYAVWKKNSSSGGGSGSGSGSGSVTQTVGDVNQDGKIDVLDAIKLKRYVLNKETLPSSMKTYADVNGDGVVNSSDVSALIKKFFNGN